MYGAPPTSKTPGHHRSVGRGVHPAQSFPGPNVFVFHDDGLRFFSDGILVYDLWTAPHVGNGALSVTPSVAHTLVLRSFENLGARSLHVNR
jgi:hypothetical protein